MGTCPSCGAERSPSALFCTQCGAALGRTCPECGSEQPATAAFCAACGTALEDGTRQPTGLDEQPERRVVTVLFADLAGSTALGATLDPEDVRQLQAELFELVGTQVERFGGVTEKFVGDAILAVFGIPQTHGDDAERAVRAGLATLELFDSFSTRVRDRHGAQVGLRIGVNTGDVVSSREAAARGELIVSGDPVNVAARLQQAAQPGQVLVGDRTRAVTSRTISYGAPVDVEIQGKSAPVQAWPAASAADAEEPRGVPGLFAPLIGRDSELALLQAVASRARDDRAPQLVTLYGHAGIGKSRLLAEFLERLETTQVLKGRCLPYGQGSTYWALAEAAKGHAGILDTDGAEVAVRKLEATVELLVGDAQADRTLDAIAWTIGLASGGGRWSAADSSEVARRLRDGWVHYLGAVGHEELAVLVLEDVHWASSPLLELVDQVADSLTDARLLLVCTARPELLETRPTWGAGKQNATALTISPLSTENTERLVAALLGSANLHPHVGQRVLATAEGNPFFVEEMLQMLIERGVLERENGSWTFSDDYADATLPDSVHGVVAARIDLLEPAAREALRRCSVVGRVFWPAAVGVDDEVVVALEKRGLVSHRPVSVMAGIREFLFKHAVTRDVAYSTLPRAERRDLHRRVAEWIEGVAPDRSLETLELTAYHYSEAIAYGEDDAELVDRAFELLLAAGNGAADRSAFEAAAPRLQRALELATSDVQRAAAELGLARFEFFSGAMENARGRLDRAETLLPPEEVALRADVLGWRSRVCWTTGRWDEALLSANAAVDALAGLPESPQLARALARRSQIEMLRGLPEATQHARETIAVARRVGDTFAEVNARINELTSEAIHGVVPDPAEVLAIVDAAHQIGSTEELYRTIVNFTWSAAGYLPVAEIEDTLAKARIGTEDVVPPAFIDVYLDLSIAMMLHVPSARWSEAEAALATVPAPRDATARLLWLSIVAALALRRGELDLAERRLEELRPAAFASGEPQRIVPMANVAVPWTVVRGRPDLLHSFSDDIIAAVDDQWSSVLTCLPIVRAVAAADEPELLERFVASMARSVSGRSSISNTVRAGEGLLALASGDTAGAVSRLSEAADRERSLGNVFFAACLDLDLARALESAGDPRGADAARRRAGSVLDPIGCVNPF